MPKMAFCRAPSAERKRLTEEPLSGLKVALAARRWGEHAIAWRLHPLTGELSGFWAVTVNANWHVMFRFQLPSRPR
ncbi:MAG: hypothetical protein C1943_16470 [Halochromatium sp.]|nr:hypothetical protein [Halochromatium sp.]